MPLKRGHPCFFHCADLTRGDGGSLPDDGPSFPSGCAGNVSALPGEPGVSLNGGIHPNSRPGLSSTAGIRRRPRHRSGNEPRPEAKRPPTLHVVRSRDTNMVRVGLPIVPELSSKPEVGASGFSSFYPFNCSRNQQKTALLLPERAREGPKTVNLLLAGQVHEQR
jgi:hypothetical protein